jgi:hypothetical protein
LTSPDTKEDISLPGIAKITKSTFCTASTTGAIVVPGRTVATCSALAGSVVAIAIKECPASDMALAMAKPAGPAPMTATFRRLDIGLLVIR